MAESNLFRGYRHALSCARRWANAARLGGDAPIGAWERGYLTGYLSGTECGACDSDCLERQTVENEVSFLFGYQERGHA